MDWITGLETHHKLVAFNVASRADWMLRVIPKYAKSPVFQQWLDSYYVEYMEEKDKPLSEGYTRADKNAKLEAIVNDFHEHYEMLKEVKDSIPQNDSEPENACDVSTPSTRDGSLARMRVRKGEGSICKKRIDMSDRSGE